MVNIPPPSSTTIWNHNSNTEHTCPQKIFQQLYETKIVDWKAHYYTHKNSQSRAHVFRNCKKITFFKQYNADVNCSQCTKATLQRRVFYTSRNIRNQPNTSTDLLCLSAAALYPDSCAEHRAIYPPRHSAPTLRQPSCPHNSPTSRWRSANTAAFHAVSFYHPWR